MTNTSQSSRVRCTFALLCLAVAACSPPSGPGRDADQDDGDLPDADPDAPDGDADSDADEEADADEDVEADAEVDTEYTGMCEACVEHPECGPLQRCIALTNSDLVCAATCVPDIPTCPRGFDCVFNFMAPEQTVCVPIGEACCLDDDADGYGVGVGCRGPDCNEGDSAINSGADERCNGFDDNCDEVVDTDSTDCGGQECADVAGGLYEETEPGTCVEAECSERRSSPCGLYTCGRGEELRTRCAVSCLDDADAEDDTLCILGAHCDLGLCVEDEPNGDPCDEDSDCVSAHCDSGFCCDDGTCCAVVDDCPGEGSIVTTCDSSSTCQGTRGEAACDEFRCTTESGIPDDSACGADVEADTCGFFRSVFCTGAVDQTTPRCPSTCTEDSECDDGAHCDVVCLPDLPDGDPCNEDSDCMSGHCNNSICCEAGDCCTEPGDCPSSYSTAPTCDTPAACQGTRDAARCLDYMCSTQADVGDDSACTSSIVASDCGLYPSVRCSGAEDQPAPVCPSFCTSDAECDAVAHCDLNACVPDLPDGQPCDENSDCESDHCQNGHCCDHGDCCGEASDCPAATYGAPSTCDSAATCQGHRVAPACDAWSICTVGSPVDDDSGCAGLTSNDCGNYPSVQCTAAATQPTDQAGRCASSCTTDLQCDPGAHCTGGVCVTDGEAGDPCELTTECRSGLTCVDNVCCRSACPGTCRACDVEGHEGDCWNVPDGTDPDGECPGFACDGYYWGWSGDSCYDRADVPDSAVGCNGSGACETASEICPTRGQGSVATTCHATCQDPNGGTCTGTTAGSCTNVNPGDQTCGVGYCARTVPQCSGGAPFTCVPGAPRLETCNNIDDDCDYTIDDDVSGAVDTYEPNATCTGARSLGTVAEFNSEQSWTATIYYSGDVDYYRFYAEEGTHSCFPFSDQDYRIRVTLIPPQGDDCRDYDLFLYNDGCTRLGSSVAGGCATDIVEYTWDGECASDDSRYFRVGITAYGWECVTYTLRIDMWQV